MKRFLFTTLIGFTAYGCATQNICTPEPAHSYGKAQAVQGKPLDYSLGGRCEIEEQSPIRASVAAGYEKGKLEFCVVRRAQVDAAAESHSRARTDPAVRYGICDNVEQMVAAYEAALKDPGSVKASRSPIASAPSRQGKIQLVPTSQWEIVGADLAKPPSDPTGFTLIGKTPYVATRECKEGEHLWCFEDAKKKRMAVKVFEDGRWNEVVGYDCKNCNWGYESLQAHNNTLWYLEAWYFATELKNGKGRSVSGKAGYSPAWPKQSHSFNPVFAISPAGTPFVVWWDGDVPNTPGNRASASRFTRGKWRWLDKRQFVRGNNYALAVGPDEKPWLLLNNGDKIFADDKGRPYFPFSVMRFNGRKWSFVGPKEVVSGASGGLDSGDITLINEKPWVVINVHEGQRSSSEDNAVVKVLKWDGRSWQPMGDIGSGHTYNHRIVSDRKGRALVAFRDNFKEVTVKRYESGTWKKLGSIGGQGWTPSRNDEPIDAPSMDEVFLDVDREDRPYVAFSQQRRVAQRGNMNLQKRVTYVMRYTGPL